MIRFKPLVAAVVASLLPLSVAQVSFAVWDADADEDVDVESDGEDVESDDEDEKGIDDKDKALNFNEAASSDDDDGDDDDGDDDDDDDDKPEVVEDPASPYEKVGQTYYFLGARYRGLILPQPMLNLFGDGGRTFYHNAFGPEIGVRKDDFEMVFAGWFASYKTDQFAYKGSSDPEDAWEIVESRLKAIYLTTDFLWTSKLTNDFSLVYGFGAGLGMVWGDLYRVQGYPVGGGYTPCSAAGDPNGNIPVGDTGMTRVYCDEDNEHYGKFSEPSWFDGGSVPVVLPWLAGQGGIRYRPHEKIAVRLDLGVGITGAFWGLAAGYQL